MRGRIRVVLADNAGCFGGVVYAYGKVRFAIPNAILKLLTPRLESTTQCSNLKILAGA